MAAKRRPDNLYEIIIIIYRRYKAGLFRRIQQCHEYPRAVHYLLIYQLLIHAVIPLEPATSKVLARYGNSYVSVYHDIKRRL